MNIALHGKKDIADKEVKDFEMGKLSQIVLNALTSILIRERSDTETKQEKAMQPQRQEAWPQRQRLE